MAETIRYRHILTWFSSRISRAMKNRTIAKDYDPNGVINGDCDAVAEFSLWREFTKRNPEEWRGDEFTLADFEEYIQRHKSNRE